jgi:hypothetical protein
MLGSAARATGPFDDNRAVRLRTLAVSVFVMVVASRWMLERVPW